MHACRSTLEDPTLSFGAVALIFFVATGERSVAGQWLRVQWAITLGLAPAALFLFAQVSVVGPLANAVAIPLVSAVVTPPAPAPGEAWITTLDVGQGLAVLVRTANRALLYDAGPAFGESDSGERIIAPYLRAVGIERLDAMVITHNDTDHAGGAASVVGNFEVDALLHSLPAGHPLPGMAPGTQRCAAGAAWEWDGVRFAILHPASAAARARKSNDLSCVLKVTAGGRSMLLTGDIERPAEAELAMRDGAALASDVLLVPHHGSRSSSTREFLAAVGPSMAVIPVGYRNRFGHPNEEVADRYRAAGIQIWRTDLEGAVTVRLAKDNFLMKGLRREIRRYWQDLPR